MKKTVLLTPAEFRILLHRHVQEAGGGGKWCARYEEDPGFLSRMRNGRVHIPDRIAKRLGYQSVVLYEPVDEEA